MTAGQKAIPISPVFQPITALEGQLTPMQGDDWGGSRQTGVHWLPPEGPGVAYVNVAGRSLSTRVDASLDTVNGALQRLLSPWIAINHICIVEAFGYFEQGSDIRVLTAWHGFKPSLEDCLVPDWKREDAEQLKYLWGEDRRKGLLQLIRDAAEGLAYIHSIKLHHGNMHLKNIILLCHDRRKAAITDIGYAGFRRAVSDQKAVMYQPFESMLLRAKTGKGQPGDVFALGCSILKAFARNWEYNVIQTTQGWIPSADEFPQIQDQDIVWDLLRLTFEKEMGLRPPMSDVVHRLEEAIKKPPQTISTIPIIAVDLVDPDVVGASFEGLSELTVSGHIVRAGERTVGGYSTVMRARWVRNDAPESIVAAKSPFSPTRPSLTREERRKRLIHRAHREAKVWDRLKHVNIVEFLGILFQSEGASGYTEPYLLSPWMRLGSLAEYLARDKDGTVDRLDLVIQVTEGVKYLHDLGIWHGDLKCQNVLVQGEDEAGGGQVTAKLCDFGLSEVIAEDFPLTSTVGTGTSGFRPPELRDRSGKKSSSLDIFSLGGLILEAFTGKPPFYKLHTEEAIRRRQDTGQFPQYADHPALGQSSPLWSLMHKCWRRIPRERPTTLQILQDLNHLHENNIRLAHQPTYTAV